MNSKIKLFMHGELGSFENPKRFVKPEGLIKDSSLILKLYDMYTKGEKNPVQKAKNFLEREMAEGRIESLSGLGFAILSKDMLNVNKWDSRCPIVVKNEIWSYEPNKNFLESIRKEDINETGSYCIWELGIVKHERGAWMKYLNSKMEEKDKLNYINNFMKGDLE